ncbi:MAG: MFS transporter [Candidatus Omnitrophota bacterium]
MPKKGKKLLILSWAMYDTANQFFALNIVSLYFVRWIILEKGAPEIFYSLAFGISTFFIAVMSPVLGTVADLKKIHRPFLVFFTLLCICFTMLLGITNNIVLALLFFAIANIGCQQAVIFYNSLMLTISSGNKAGFVSGLGKMFGYLGAIIALFFSKSIIAHGGYSAVFISTGLMFLIFSLPCLLFVKDDRQTAEKNLKIVINKKLVINIFKQLKIVLFNSPHYLALREFLKAGFFGLCVVNITMLFMSIYVTKVFGLNDIEITNFAIFSGFFALVGSICSGIISDFWGYKRTMFGIFFLWILCLLGGALVIKPFHWIVGAIAGISLGSTWVVSRALVINIVPEEKTGEAFGLFNCAGYVSGIVGSIIWGLMMLLFKPFGVLGYRVALLCLIPFLVIGCMYLLRVPDAETNIYY